MGADAIRSSPVARIVLIYAEQTVEKDGRIINTPIRTVVPDDLVNVREAARVAGKSPRQIRWWCENGYLKSARRTGPTPKSSYVISRAELLALRRESGA